jgi:hypothetical protein
MNVITGIPRSKIPMAFDTDRDAIQTALHEWPHASAQARRPINNTLHLTELECSQALLAEVTVPDRSRPGAGAGSL